MKTESRISPSNFMNSVLFRKIQPLCKKSDSVNSESKNLTKIANCKRLNIVRS